MPRFSAPSPGFDSPSPLKVVSTLKTEKHVASGDERTWKSALNNNTLSTLCFSAACNIVAGGMSTLGWSNPEIAELRSRVNMLEHQIKEIRECQQLAQNVDRNCKAFYDCV